MSIVWKYQSQRTSRRKGPQTSNDKRIFPDGAILKAGLVALRFFRPPIGYILHPMRAGAATATGACIVTLRYIFARACTFPVCDVDKYLKYCSSVQPDTLVRLTTIPTISFIIWSRRYGWPSNLDQRVDYCLCSPLVTRFHDWFVTLIFKLSSILHKSIFFFHLKKIWNSSPVLVIRNIYLQLPPRKSEVQFIGSEFRILLRG